MSWKKIGSYSKDLGIGRLKLAIVNFWVSYISKDTTSPQYTKIKTIKMHLGHDILIKCQDILDWSENNSIICLKMTFEDVTLKKIWVS